jgi:para-nitrobenzyl esterase
MKLLTTGFSIALLSSIAVVALAAESDPIVQVTGGQMKGSSIPGGGATFKGVPFAQPPVGDLRWREPAPVKSWTGVRDAQDFGPPCTQQASRNQKSQASQEDCLTLNVWTAEWPSKSPKPVMVWLYGGGNTAGLTSVEYLDGTSLSRRGIVVVTVNYRVGLLGFFAHPGLTAESPHHSSGNYGLMDQVAALKWVHENIAKLGGDPGRVTLFGQSAGGIDTAYLATSPSLKGLIHRSIQESGSPIHPIGTLAQVEQLGVKFAESQKAPADAAEAVKFLRARPAAELQKIAASTVGLESLMMWPLIDGTLIPKYPALTYQEGKELPIPMITGSNAHEEARNYDIEAMKRVIKANFGSLAPKAEEFYGLANGGTGKEDPLYGTTLAQIPTDTKHRCGAVFESFWRSSHGRTTYQYQFDVPIAGEPFTKHTAEIPFVFGNLLPPGVPMGGPYTDADRKVSNDIQTYWANFARTGNPNGNGLPEWPKANPKSRPYLEFTIHDGPVVREAQRRELCEMYIEGLKETIPGNTAGSR